MLEPIAKYSTRVTGVWSTRHVIFSGDGAEPASPIGIVTVDRSGKGLVVGARYAPQKGEVVHFRRDPGLLRSQFSMWTEGREWLGSSLRWSFLGREIVLATGSKPYRLLPVPGFRRGWRMVAPKTGEMARITPLLLRRGSRIEVYRKTDFELVLFAYFVGWQILLESLWPGEEVESDRETVPTPSKAPSKT